MRIGRFLLESEEKWQNQPLEEMPDTAQATLILKELGEYFSSMCRMGHKLHSFPNRSLLDSEEFFQLLPISLLVGILIVTTPNTSIYNIYQ